MEMDKEAKEREAEEGVEVAEEGLEEERGLGGRGRGEGGGVVAMLVEVLVGKTRLRESRAAIHPPPSSPLPPSSLPPPPPNLGLFKFQALPAWIFLSSFPEPSPAAMDSFLEASCLEIPCQLFETSPSLPPPPPPPPSPPTPPPATTTPSVVDLGEAAGPTSLPGRSHNLLIFLFPDFSIFFLSFFSCSFLNFVFFDNT